MLVAAFIAALGPSAPAPPTIALAWEAPLECPGIDAVGQWVQSFSGARLASVEDAELVAKVWVEPRETGFHARVHVRGRDDEDIRELQARDCELLARAVAVILAVALDPIAVVEAVHPAQPNREDTPSDGDQRDRGAHENAGVALVPAAERSREVTRPKRGGRPAGPPARAAEAGPPARRPSLAPRLEAGTRIGLGVGDFVLPSVGPGFVAAPFVGVRRFHARLVLQYWVPRSSMLAGRDDAGVRVQLASAGLRACPRFVWGRWSVPLCTGPDFGVLPGRGIGDGLARSASAASFWAAWTVEAGFEVRVLRFLSLWAAFEGAVSLNRPGFFLEEALVHRVGRFGPRGALGVTFHR